uniref:Uncharacterized protein n=1 Tax=Setaria italica TaxID=4555 RepID=K3YXF1_SETIT
MELWASSVSFFRIHTRAFFFHRTPPSPTEQRGQLGPALQLPAKSIGGGAKRDSVWGKNFAGRAQSEPEP